MERGVVHSICVSGKRGELKKEIPMANILTDWGIENDAHGGPGEDGLHA